MNLYQYAGGNPGNRADALGLDSYYDITDPDFDLDATLSDFLGGRVYVLGAIADGVHGIDLGLQTMARVAMSLFGIDSAQAIACGQGGFWDYLDVAVSLCPPAKGGAILAKASKLKLVAKAGKYIGKMIRHHTVPVAVLDKLPEAVRRSGRVQGRRACKNIWMIPEDLHKDLHRGAGGGPWNEAWELEIESQGGYANMTADIIVEIREKLVKEFGLEKYRP